MRRRIGVTGQYAGLDDFLTTCENLELVGRLAGLRGAARGRASDLVDRFDLRGVADRRVGELSGGTRRRVDLAASLVGSPSVLFLDEPTTGLDPAARQALWTVVPSSPRPARRWCSPPNTSRKPTELADQVVVLDHGRIAAQGTPSELKNLVGGTLVRATIPAHRVRELPRRPDATEPVEHGRVRRVLHAARRGSSRPARRRGRREQHRAHRPRRVVTQPRRRLLPPRHRRSPDMNAPSGTLRERPVALDQLAILVRRNLRTSARVPQLLMFSLTMPMAMLVLFSQVFRSVADSSGFPAGVSYIDFLTPAMLAVATVMAGTNAGVAAAIDHTNGLHDRFATLPMSSRLPSAARTINEALFTLARGALLIAAAVALGLPVPRQRARRRRLGRRARRAGGGDERPVRPHRRPGAPTRRRPVRRDDDHDALHVRLRRLRPAGDDARLDANDGHAQPGAPTPPRPYAATCSAPPPWATRLWRSPPRPRCGPSSRWCRASGGELMRYVFGDCELEPQRYELRRHGQVRPIEPQVFDVLVLLIQERHRVVTKQELLDTVWGHRFVGESALTSRIKSLRQAVGDDGTTQGIVRTVRSRGYQFIAHVIERANPSTPPRPRPVRCRKRKSRLWSSFGRIRLAGASVGAVGAPPGGPP